MKIANKKLWAEFQKPGLCELCKKPCMLREPHHYFSRTPEITVRIGLISVGSTLRFECDCHAKCHSGRITRNELLAHVAAREKLRVDDVESVLLLFRRLIKPTQAELVAALEELNLTAKQLAVRELKETPKFRKWVELL